MSATVLVAEDELLIALDIVDELEGAGFRIAGPFARARDAIEFCRQRMPDCAVLDVRLQDGECFPLADLLAEQGAPIVFHSGHASRQGLSERYPQAEVCPKPAPSARIAALVRNLCRGAGAAEAASGHNVSSQTA
jgi:DNA-binding LytR/AlgR family response regulator